MSATTAIALGDSTNYNIYSKKFYLLMGSVFLIHAVINLSHYLEKLPLPEPEVDEPAKDATLVIRAAEPSSKV